MKYHIFRLVIISCLLITTFFVGGTVLAQDEELPDSGITPDSPFYFLDKLTKNIGMFFTFGDEAKANKALRYAEERLSEARVMAMKNKFREMTRAANDYNGFMAMVTERLEAAAKNGTPDRISENISAAFNRIHTGLDELKDKLPHPQEENIEPIDEETQEEASTTIDNALTATQNIQVRALRILGENKPQRALDICADVAERHLERVRTRTIANPTSLNVSEDIDFALRIAALEEELVNLADEKGIDVSDIIERLTQSTSKRLEVLIDVYSNAPTSARQGIGDAIENSVEKYEKVVQRAGDANVSTSISIDITQTQNIEEKLRERLQLENSNHEYTTDDTPVNAGIRVMTENELQNQEQNQIPDNTPQTTANQTLSQQNQEKNNEDRG